MRLTAPSFVRAAGLLWAMLVLQVVLWPQPAAAFSEHEQREQREHHDNFGDFGDFGESDFDWTILQMQREAITSQEEQAREAGRSLRRQEVEQLQRQQSSEHQEYFESVLEASQAALRAPRGAYYRKPGDSSQETPAGAQQVEAGGVAYLYDQGVFWLLPGPPYLVVVAPYGAVVDKIPPAAYRIVGKAAPRYYYFGTFFEEKGGKFEVIKPPAGTLVSYLPDGYRLEQAQGAALYTFGPTSFKPVFVQGVLVYQVVER